MTAIAKYGGKKFLKALKGSRGGVEKLADRLDADEDGVLFKVQKPGDAPGESPVWAPDVRLEDLRGLSCAEMAFLVVICGELALVPGLEIWAGLVVALLGTALVMYCMSSAN